MSNIIPKSILKPSSRERAWAFATDAARALAQDAGARVASLTWPVGLALLAILAVGIAIRLLALNALGFNTDEAVYAGQAGGILNNLDLKPFFPVFRAHPLLFQFVLALTYAVTGVNDYVGRLVSVLIGVITLLAVFAAGKSLYSATVGLLAALLMAVMPYHVIVTRQVLLDGPMTLCATLTLCALAQFGKVQSTRWLVATGLCLGLTFLTKETGIILLGSVFLFLALSRTLKLRLLDLLVATAVMLLMMALFPLVITLAGAARTGQNYLLWQLLRPANHEATFYLTTVLPQIGLPLLLCIAAGIALRWKQGSWRETLLLAWIVVPLVFFQLWPVKGFQYLLPIVPALVLLAAAAIAHYDLGRQLRIGPFAVGAGWVSALVAALIVITLAVPSLQTVQATAPATAPTTASQDMEGLAGTGGLPGGRETGLWFKQHTLPGTQAMAIGPSIANLVQFYGFRKTYMLSISTNPSQRNPAYDPIENPNLQLLNGEIHYLVWDAYSADRSTFFSDKLLGFVKQFNGRAVHTETVNGKAVVVVYEVHP